MNPEKTPAKAPEALPLTDAGIGRATRAHKRIGGGGRMFLELCWLKDGTPSHKFRMEYDSPEDVGPSGRGRVKTYSIGTYPEVSISAAKIAAEAARALVRSGVCPNAQKARDKAAAERSKVLAKREEERVASMALRGEDRGDDLPPAIPGSYRAFAERFHASKRPTEAERAAGKRDGWGHYHAAAWLGVLRNHVYGVVPEGETVAIGDMDVRAVKRPMVQPIVDNLLAYGQNAAAGRVKHFAAQVTGYAKHLGVLEFNPLEGMTRLSRRRKKGFAAVATVKDLEELVREIDTYGVMPGVKQNPVRRRCLLACLYTAQRGGNVLAMKWADLRLDIGLWVIPGKEMKASQEIKREAAPHYVPLSSQCVAVLREQLAECEKDAQGRPVSAYVFSHSDRKVSRLKPMCKRLMSDTLNAMGFKDRHTIHGFRATFRSLCRVYLKVHADILEAQLAHKTGEELGDAYDRAKWEEDRVEVVQAWADWLDAVRAGEAVRVAPVRPAFEWVRTPATV